MKQQRNILFTSAGRRSYLIKYFRDALDGNGTVHAANSSPWSSAVQAADRAVITPLIYSDEYIPFLLDYCAKWEIDLVIPLFDIDVYVLAANRERFTEIGVTVIVPDECTARICNDKWLTYQFLTENHFCRPETVCNLDDALNYIRDGRMSYPLMVKPRWGMGSIGVTRVEDETELRVIYDMTRRKVSSSYLRYESDQDPDHCVLIQQMLEGQEYGCDIINDLKGDYQATIVKKKIAMRAGETDCAEVVIDPKISIIAERLAEKTRHLANMDVDVFVNDNGDVYILELNARFGGGYPFSHLAGVNLPLAILSWARGEYVSGDILTPKVGTIGMKGVTIQKIELETGFMDGGG